MSSPATAEDRQRLTTQLEDLQIELGYLRQCGKDIIERADRVSRQLHNLNDRLGRPIGDRAAQD